MLNEIDVVQMCAVKIVAAYFANNDVPPDQISTVLIEVHDAVKDAISSARDVNGSSDLSATLATSQMISNSVHDKYIICLESGKKLQTLRRHLRNLGMTPDEYKKKWGLPETYPMTAPDFSRKRSLQAKNSGLGRKGFGQSDSERSAVNRIQ